MGRSTKLEQTKIEACGNPTLWLLPFVAGKLDKLELFALCWVSDSVIEHCTPLQWVGSYKQLVVHSERHILVHSEKHILVHRVGAYLGAQSWCTVRCILVQGCWVHPGESVHGKPSHSILLQPDTAPLACKSVHALKIKWQPDINFGLLWPSFWQSWYCAQLQLLCH